MCYILASIEFKGSLSQCFHSSASINWKLPSMFFKDTFWDKMLILWKIVKIKSNTFEEWVKTISHKRVFIEIAQKVKFDLSFFLLMVKCPQTQKKYKIWKKLVRAVITLISYEQSVGIGFWEREKNIGNCNPSWKFKAYRRFGKFSLLQWRCKKIIYLLINIKL